MSVAGLVLQSLQQARVYLELRVDVCPDEALFHRLQGSSLQSIAAIYAHAVVTEDHYVQRGLRGAEPLFECEEWRSRVTLPPGVALDARWAREFAPEIGALREYARAVYEASDEFFGGDVEAQLAELTSEHMVTHDGTHAVIRPVEVSRAFHFMDNVVLHTVEHAAEMGALLGVQGLKANPWE